MTTEVSDWLPLGATTREALRAKLDAAVRAWAEAWFAARSLRVSRLTAAPAGKDSGGWRLYRAALTIRRSEAAAARLLDWALDADVAQLCASDADHRLVEAFERRLIEDLIVRVEEELGLDEPMLAESQAADPFAGHGGIVAEVTDGEGDVVLLLAAPLKAVLPACRASLPPVEWPRGGLDRLSAAIADVEVTIEARLGQAHLTLPEAKALEVGDVLVLDTALEEAATLLLRGSEHAFAHATLTNFEGDVTLTLQA